MLHLLPVPGIAPHLPANACGWVHFGCRLDSSTLATLQVQDYGDVVIHVFEPAQREYYDLEGFYGAAEEVRQACLLMHGQMLVCLSTAQPQSAICK